MGGGGLNTAPMVATRSVHDVALLVAVPPARTGQQDACRATLHAQTASTRGTRLADDVGELPRVTRGLVGVAVVAVEEHVTLGGVDQ